MHPASGFTAELSAASIVLIASTLGIPVSSTHILVGAVLGNWCRQPRHQLVTNEAYWYGVDNYITLFFSSRCNHTDYATDSTTMNKPRPLHKR